MTDLELTKICADAMGLKVELLPHRGTIMRYKFMDGHVQQEYNPLYNDAQAMALVKRFSLTISKPQMWWDVSDEDGHEAHVRGDLNRAIVECVAKMYRTIEHQSV